MWASHARLAPVAAARAPAQARTSLRRTRARVRGQPGHAGEDHHDRSREERSEAPPEGEDQEGHPEPGQRRAGRVRRRERTTTAPAAQALRAAAISTALGLVDAAR